MAAQLRRENLTTKKTMRRKGNGDSAQLAVQLHSNQAACYYGPEFENKKNTDDRCMELTQKMRNM